MVERRLQHGSAELHLLRRRGRNAERHEGLGQHEAAAQGMRRPQA